MVQTCPHLNSQGSCSNSSCPYNHDIHVCEDCGVVCPTLSNYRSHIGSKRHKRQLSGANTFLRCHVCKVNIRGPQEWTKHISSGGHQKKAKRQGASPAVEPEEAASTSKSEYCNLCRQFVSRTVWAQHARSSGHKRKEKFVAYKATLEEAEKNKHGVIVSDGLDFGIISPSNAQKGVSVHFTMETTVPTSRIRIIGAKLSSTSAKNISSA